MLEIDILEECMIELAPFGSFPAWSLRDVQKTELPEFERGQQNREMVFA